LWDRRSTGVDTPTQGFTSGHGATVTAANSTFVALPGSNPPLGVANTLNIGDDLEATGAAASASTLMYTAAPSFINPPLVTGVTMNGVSAAIVTNLTAGTAGFSGNITGLTSATLAAGSLGAVRLGASNNGLNTALTDITIGSSETFTAWMTAAAFGAGTDTATIHLQGVDTTVNVLVTTGTTGYGSLTVDSGGNAANILSLTGFSPITGTFMGNLATITATGAQNLTISGGAMDIAFLHKFDASATTGAWRRGLTASAPSRPLAAAGTTLSPSRPALAGGRLSPARAPPSTAWVVQTRW
jgi:hypothetical protein